MRIARHSKWIWEHRGFPAFTWDEAALSVSLSSARRAQGRAAGVASLLDPSVDMNAQLEVLTHEGLATSAIEGERFDPRALRSSIARKLGLDAAGLPKPSRSIDGLVEVLIDATEKHSAPLTLERLCGWQASLFPTGRSGLHAIKTGELRGDAPMRIVSGPAHRELVHFVAPPRDRLEQELGRFLDWFAAPPPGLDGVVRAGIAHAWFEILHPFEDGNGRVGRAVLDMALAQDEHRASRLYSVSAQFMAERDAYYAQLERLSAGGLDVTPWLAWFVEQLAIAASRAEVTTARVLAKAAFWLKHGDRGLNERQRKALNRMLDAGPDGFVGGMTNRKYASLTGASTATAQRDLGSLVALGCLELVGHGRAARYELVR